jgi:alkylhydroperoxidase family enzyme
MFVTPVQPWPEDPRRNNRATTDTNPAMTSPDAVRAIQSLWSATEAGGAPATNLDLLHLRASHINGDSTGCTGTASGKQDVETDKRLLDDAPAARMLSIATTDVFNRLNVTARPVAGPWGPG